MMKAEDKPIQLGLRLKIQDGKITEAEHLLVREFEERSLANLQEPRPGLLTIIPEDERMGREEILKIGASYYDALVMGDGSLSPFADDCVRCENGMLTTSNPPPKEGETGLALFGSMGSDGIFDAVQLKDRLGVITLP